MALTRGTVSVSGAGGGHTLNIRGTFDVTGSVFDNTAVTIDANITPAGNTFSQPTFQNMNTGITQLSVRLRGGTLEIGNAIFSTAPVSPGVYIHAESADASVLTVNLTGSSPSDGNGLTESEGTNAVINWDIDIAAQQQNQDR